MTFNQLPFKLNVEINFAQDGAMPIFIAAENGFVDVMPILIHHGAKFRVQREEGKMPMDIALPKGYTRIAEILHHAAEENLKKQDNADPSTAVPDHPARAPEK